MKENIINPKAATEVLEIIKYFDGDLKENLNMDFIKQLECIKDNNYKFEINKNIPLYENSFMEETIDILGEIFID